MIHRINHPRGYPAYGGLAVGDEARQVLLEPLDLVIRNILAEEANELLSHARILNYRHHNGFEGSYRKEAGSTNKTETKVNAQQGTSEGSIYRKT